MHRHNLDQIAEYAQGILPDETAAAALVESCETCRAEYETQRSMISLLDVSAAEMTEHEKAALHRDLWTQLRSPNASTDPAARNWKAWAFGAAAALFVVVGVAGVFTNLGGADSVSDEFAEISRDLGADGAEAADTTTTAAAGATAEEAPEGDTAPVGQLSALEYQAIADAVRSDDRASTFGAYDDASDETACLEQAGLADHIAVRGYESETDLIVAVPAENDGDHLTVFFVEPSTCELVNVED